METVLIKHGTYRNAVITNQVFEMHKPYNPSGFITVIGTEEDGLRDGPCRIKVEVDGYEYKGSNMELKVKSTETEADAIKRIATTFSHLNKFANAAVAGIIRGLIIVGPPGIGKSHGVEQVLRESSVFKRMANPERESYEVIKGSISASMLYRKLYQFSGSDQVLVLDDCDIEDEESLNLLKGALDSCDKRVISWYKDAQWLERDGIPCKFEFKGSIIFLTNIDFANAKGKKAVHLHAIVSRCHYMDLEINSQRDRVLRIKQIVADGMLSDYEFAPELELEMVNYISDNVNHMRELSLRCVKKLADLVKAFPTEWREFAVSTLMLPSAKSLFNK